MNAARASGCLSVSGVSDSCWRKRALQARRLAKYAWVSRGVLARLRRCVRGLQGLRPVDAAELRQGAELQLEPVSRQLR